MPIPVAAVAIPAVAAGFQALLGFFGTKSSNRSIDRSAQLQNQTAMRTAEMAERAQAAQLAFLQEQEATRRREHESAEARNYKMYIDELNEERGRYGDLQSRLKPYRQAGVGSLGQLARPVPGLRPGSLGARMGG